MKLKVSLLGYFDLTLGPHKKSVIGGLKYYFFGPCLGTLIFEYKIQLRVLFLSRLLLRQVPQH